MEILHNHVIMCLYWACAGPMLAASAQYRPSTGKYRKPRNITLLVSELGYSWVISSNEPISYLQMSSASVTMTVNATILQYNENVELNKCSYPNFEIYAEKPHTACYYLFILSVISPVLI